MWDPCYGLFFPSRKNRKKKGNSYPPRQQKKRTAKSTTTCDGRAVMPFCCEHAQKAEQTRGTRRSVLSVPHVVYSSLLATAL